MKAALLDGSLDAVIGAGVAEDRLRTPVRCHAHTEKGTQILNGIVDSSFIASVASPYCSVVDLPGFLRKVVLLQDAFSAIRSSVPQQMFPSEQKRGYAG